jgi:GntR family transcriptional repressor for pyruvate dehydrogenase complex
MPFETIRKASAPEMVAEQILSMIEAGEVLPGEKLPPQRELAKLLGVGRSSVREAINALTVMGYLSALHGKGTFVRESLPTMDDSVANLNKALAAGGLVNLMEARELLEVASAKLAAERADENQIERLKSTLLAMQNTPEDYDSFLVADIAFHKTISEATLNVVICELTKLVLDKVIQHHAKLKTALLPPRYRQTSIETAQKTVAAIEAGREEEAGYWMQVHLDAIREELKEIIT